ncbi:hypothetical protein F8197_05690 [Duganella sp. FT27W]|nr:hypothetical protein [Duganella sp. FT27W]
MLDCAASRMACTIMSVRVAISTGGLTVLTSTCSTGVMRVVDGISGQWARGRVRAEGPVSRMWRCRTAASAVDHDGSTALSHSQATAGAGVSARAPAQASKTISKGIGENHDIGWGRLKLGAPFYRYLSNKQNSLFGSGCGADTKTPGAQAGRFTCCALARQNYLLG